MAKLSEQEQAQVRAQARQELADCINIVLCQNGSSSARLLKVIYGCAAACFGLAYEFGASSVWSGKEVEVGAIFAEEACAAVEEQFTLALR